MRRALGVVAFGVFVWQAGATTHCQFTSFNDRQVGNTLLEGNFQSCLGGGGEDQAHEYSEQVWEHRTRVGKTFIVDFEVHFGPRDEFAVFKGSHDLHPSHEDHRNLLLPAYKYGPWQGLVGGRTWHFHVDNTQYRLNAVLAGGSRDDCESYFIKLERMPVKDVAILRFNYDR